MFRRQANTQRIRTLTTWVDWKHPAGTGATVPAVTLCLEDNNLLGAVSREPEQLTDLHCLRPDGHRFTDTVPLELSQLAWFRKLELHKIQMGPGRS